MCETNPRGGQRASKMTEWKALPVDGVEVLVNSRVDRGPGRPALRGAFRLPAGSEKPCQLLKHSSEVLQPAPQCPRTSANWYSTPAEA